MSATNMDVGSYPSAMSENRIPWQGLGFPARPLSDEELDVLSPRCSVCHLPATVIELQGPFNKDTPYLAIVDLDVEYKFYCSHHSPIALADEYVQLTDQHLYERTRKPIRCPKKGHHKYACNCLRLQPTCIKSCEPLKAMVGGFSMRTAQASIRAAWEKEQKRKKEEEEEKAYATSGQSQKES